jgi:hypothetical protein
MFVCRSELILQRELHLAGAARRARHPSAGGRVHGRVGRVEAGRVGDVERLGAELQPLRPNPELLEEREIEGLVAVLSQNAAAGIAVRELRRKGERRLVEPERDLGVVDLA